MTKTALSLLALVAWGACSAWAEAADAWEEDLEAAGGELTVITSDRLTFDYQRRFALFEGHVVVTDPEMKIEADAMTARFDEEQHITSIVAQGRVRIEQQDRIAFAGRATYDVASGRITLEENPRVQRGRDELSGAVITFWRHENRLVCEPGARLVLYPERGGARDHLLGE